MTDKIIVDQHYMQIRSDKRTHEKIEQDFENGATWHDLTANVLRYNRNLSQKQNSTTNGNKTSNQKGFLNTLQLFS